MEWIFFTLIAVGLWAAINIQDKHVLSHELRDPVLVTTVFCLTMYIFFIVVSSFNSGIMMPMGFIFIAIIAGIIYSVSLWGYYYSLYKEEVSKIVPVFAIEPFFIALLSFFIFSERLTILNYLGILIIVAGAILISHENSRKRIKKKSIVIVAVGVTILWTIRNLIFEHLTSQIELWPVLFWFGVGGIIIPVFLLIFHHPHLRKQAKRGVRHIILNALISALALFAFIKAISLGPVSLVVALLSTKPLIVFIGATLLSYYRPRFMCEKHSGKVLVQRVLATILIVVGGIMIIF